MAEDEEGPKIGDSAVIGAGSEELGEAEITEIFAFVAVVGGNAREMIVSMMTPRGIMPLITSHANQVDAMEKTAQEFADESKTDVKLVKFTKTETVKTVSHRLVEPGPQILH